MKKDRGSRSMAVVVPHSSNQRERPATAGQVQPPKILVSPTYRRVKRETKVKIDRIGSSSDNVSGSALTRDYR